MRFFLFCMKIFEYEKLDDPFLKLHEYWNDSYSNVHVLDKLENWGFHVLFLKTTAEKWPGGGIPMCSDCILLSSLLFCNVLVDVPVLVA